MSKYQVTDSDLKQNPALQFVVSHNYAPYSVETGVKKIITGDHSHKCPVYTVRVPPCTESCPAGEDIRGYHNILRGIEKTPDKWKAAFERMTDKNPFPSIMGRVCPAPCESGCNRQFVDETVGINSVEHAVGEYAIKNNLPLHPAGKDTGKHIAIVGAGPAGLSAAYQLRRMGHKVTIFEARQNTGGMMRYGIMGYRVDREILDAEIKRILSLGVELKTGIRIGKEISIEELEKKHDAVFIGVGAQKGRLLPIKGFADTSYTTSAIEFLIQFEANPSKMVVGKNVVVIGDGDVAMDVARLSLRLGSNSTILSAVDRADMNCKDYEYDEAISEGSKVEFCTSVTEVIRDGDKVTGVKCVKMEKKAKGEEGWNAKIPFLRYKPIAGSEFTIQTDMVVASIGQATDMSGFEKYVNSNGYFDVDFNFQVKGQEKIFAGGDAVKIDLITTAVGHGRKAAEAINQLVAQQPLPGKTRYEVVTHEKIKSYYFEPSQKTKRSHIKIDSVKNNFTEILQPLSDEMTVWESGRCMSCGLCFNCKQCLLYCPQEAISHNKNKPLGETMFTDYKKCVGCHICADICPCGYIDMGMGEDL